MLLLLPIHRYLLWEQVQLEENIIVESIRQFPSQPNNSAELNRSDDTPGENLSCYDTVLILNLTVAAISATPHTASTPLLYPIPQNQPDLLSLATDLLTSKYHHLQLVYLRSSRVETTGESNNAIVSSISTAENHGKGSPSMISTTIFFI